MAETLVALDSFVGSLNGRQVNFMKGEAVSSDNPAAKKWPELFGPVSYRQELINQIEQATAAPGERRKR